MKTHLKYNWLDANLRHKEFRHAQEYMQDIGVKYEHSTCQGHAETWIFWNCTNIPKNLPSFIKIAELNPMEFIGWGLTEEKAKELSYYKTI